MGIRTAFTELLGIEHPLVGFSRSPAVVAEVTNADGLGVLAATAYTPEQLDAQLTWIVEQVDGRPFGVDLLVPEKTHREGTHCAATERRSRRAQGGETEMRAVGQEGVRFWVASGRIGCSAVFLRRGVVRVARTAGWS
jgi:NAD(P)H-dependent flavin oxidoreductase YrpB (nitropropane dioxygenase family)